MIEIVKQGRRYYLTGAPFEAKHRLKDAGCRWDPAMRAWWTGKAQRAKDLVSELREATRESSPTPTNRVIVGRAQYRGKSYYLLWYGTKRDGSLGAKLMFRDGTRVFWARDVADVTGVVTYRNKRSLQELGEYARRKRQDDTGRCRECERWCTCDKGFCAHHHDGCETCGSER